MTVFTRTAQGLAEKWRFHREPTIWVEGPSDILFYEPLTHDLSCRIEAMHGKLNAAALVNALKVHDYPYMVVLDGDYEALKKTRAPHRNVIVLKRYSHENYLWESYAVNQACLRHAREGARLDLVGSQLIQLALELKRELAILTALDIAARHSPSPPTVLPRTYAQIGKTGALHTIERQKVNAIVRAVLPQVQAVVLSSANRDLKAFLKTRCITHILNGHLVFSILSSVFRHAITKHTGQNRVLSNDALTQLLSTTVWRKPPSADHTQLKRAFRSKVRELGRRFGQIPVARGAGGV
jgi:hypothetical protein